MKKKCIICGSTKLLSKKYGQHKKIKYTLKQRIKKTIKKTIKRELFSGNINVCGSCGYGIMKNIPDENKLKKYYNKQYWDWRAVDVSEILNKYKNDLRSNTQTQLVYKYLSEINNVLEIGAGAAFASLKLKELFREKNNKEIKLYVCEPGKQWIEYYKEINILKIADFFPFSSDIKFDYIHTSHWIEHVADIKQTVKDLNNLLNENGCLFVEVPNTSKTYWDLNFKDIPHIHFFTKASLKKLMDNNGFNCLYIEECGITIQEYYSKFSVNHYNKNENGVVIRGVFKKLK